MVGTVYMGGTVCVSICVCALTSGSKGSRFLHPGQQESSSLGYFEVRYTSGFKLMEMDFSG